MEYLSATDKLKSTLSGLKELKTSDILGSMEDCIFCKIANSDPKGLVLQTETVAAFNDIQPKAPVHILVVPRKHIDRLDSLTDKELAGDLLLAVREAAHKAGLKGRFRVAVNNGREAGQIVDHLHFHVLGQDKAGKPFATPGAATDQSNGLL
jgi:histidine triad (HIT) family protein